MKSPLRACWLVGRTWFGLCVIATLLLISQGVFAQSTDVFGRTSTGAPSAANTAESSKAAPASDATATASGMQMPSVVRDAIGWSVRLQSRLNERMQDELADQRDGSSMAAAWTLVLFSFGYGVLHALGPGHGKIVVSAYLASHRARFIDAVTLSVWSAFVQALSAILLVSAAAWLSREGLSRVLTRASGLELTSYIALLGVGAWTLWSIVTRRDCCEIDRVELVPRKRLSVAAKRDVDDGDEREARYLGSSLGQLRSRTSWTPTRTSRGSFWIARQIFLTGVAVGVRPCVGAIFVLIAALANHIFMVGILSALAMGAGVSCTVLAIGATSLSLNRAVSKRSAITRQKVERIRFGLALAGAVFITLFAAWQVIALMTGLQAAALA
ncbi:nickel/cobalt transporter [Caballeronia sp.]|uniref:nickel/cobalt transporter n=1 Tax=Caballeronia sp. TaxID=1931223 RepID=UPI003C32B2D4